MPGLPGPEDIEEEYRQSYPAPLGRYKKHGPPDLDNPCLRCRRELWQRLDQRCE